MIKAGYILVVLAYVVGGVGAYLGVANPKNSQGVDKGIAVIYGAFLIHLLIEMLLTPAKPMDGFIG